MHGGGRYVDPALAADALTAPECPLTPRELDVLRPAELATPVSEVSHCTSLSIGSVRNHLSAAVSTLKVANRAEAFRTTTRSPAGSGA
ncbi:LuxR C-terminal-related transcriptional regulator [Micromonospora sp. NBC_00362]|nr:LuxR C-terminal-related transcriptional regulator [Micromonospora sp. NBC_00362]